MQLALAGETVEYADTLQPLTEELLTRACREGNRDAHLALEHFLHAQGRHGDAEALTPLPESPAPHDPAQLLHDAAAGDATALERLRKVADRRNETFHQIAAAAFTASPALWSWPTKLARAGSPELVEPLLRAATDTVSGGPLEHIRCVAADARRVHVDGGLRQPTRGRTRCPRAGGPSDGGGRGRWPAAGVPRQGRRAEGSADA